MLLIGSVWSPRPSCVFISYNPVHGDIPENCKKGDSTFHLCAQCAFFKKLNIKIHTGVQSILQG